MRIAIPVWLTAALAWTVLANPLSVWAARPASGDRIVVRPINAVPAPASTRIGDGPRVVTLMDADTGLEVVPVSALPTDKQETATELMFGLQSFSEDVLDGKSKPADLSNVDLATSLSPDAGSAVEMLTSAMNDPRCSARVLASAVNKARLELQKNGLNLSAVISPAHGATPARANLTLDLIRAPDSAPNVE